MDLIFGFATQFMWPIIIGLLGLLGFLGYGAKKKHDGRVAERERAKDAQIAAARDAVRTRDSAAAKPIEQQRGDVERWER